ncbi:MAG TPA: histidine kinase, partial [Bacteroidia bacterium]
MIGEYRKRIIKNLTRKYILALLLLSALTVFSFIFFLYSIRTTDKDGYMINLSGKARFYVQRVALAGLQYVCDTNSQKRSVLLTTLKNRITEMEDAHNILTHDTVSITSKYHSPEIDSIYFNAPVFLDKKTNMFLSEAHLLANSNEVELTMNNRHLQYLLNSCNDLLASLNLVVYQYQKENEDEIHGFYYENTLTSVSLVLSYLIVGFFIFRPMTKEINRTLIDLEYKEEELQQSNEKHIAAIIDAQEQERQRIATDLHDGLIQTLATLSYRFDVAGKMKDDTYFHET